MRQSINKTNKTNPSFRDTLRSTPILIGCTRELSIGIALTSVALVSYIFIRIVETVIVTVANIDARNTISIIACEKVSKTSPFLTLTIFFGFVCFRSATIIVSITIPGRRNTTMIRTTEAIRRTCSLRTY